MKKAITPDAVNERKRKDPTFADKVIGQITRGIVEKLQNGDDMTVKEANRITKLLTPIVKELETLRFVAALVDELMRRTDITVNFEGERVSTVKECEKSFAEISELLKKAHKLYKKNAEV